jgi:hypothetical protein
VFGIEFSAFGVSEGLPSDTRQRRKIDSQQLIDESFNPAAFAMRNPENCE